MPSDRRENPTWGDAIEETDAADDRRTDRRAGRRAPATLATLAALAALAILALVLTAAVAAAWLAGWGIPAPATTDRDRTAAGNTRDGAVDAASDRSLDPPVNVPGPRDPPVSTSFAELHAEARDLARELTTSLPKSDEAWCFAGRVHQVLDEPAEAQECWKTALSLKPDSVATLTAMGEAARKGGDFEGSARRFREAIAADRAVGMKVILLADALLCLGRAPEAVAVLEESARLSPLPPRGLSLLGQAYMETGKHANAASCFGSALAANPNSFRDHFAISRCYDKLGDRAKAKEHREQYARLKKQQLAEVAGERVESRGIDFAGMPAFVREAHVLAGKLYAAREKPKAAEEHWLRAVALDPAAPEPRALLAGLYRKQGRPADAVRVSASSDAAPVSP